ncbi:MAG: GAF domain-containing protein [Myxococcota bacterium]|nr:GAF domain-containing protein [Myxococcota bacterium]
MHFDIYRALESQLEGDLPWMSVLSTTVCALHHGFSHFHWTGFYCVSAPSLLSVGPYQGGHGCIWIPFERGVCGAAARTKSTQWVRDVHKRPDHIACSTSTNSEVVVPVLYEGEVVAVLDVDSDLVDAFSAEDVAFLELVAKLVASKYKPV